MKAGKIVNERGLVVNVMHEDGRTGTAFLPTIATGPLAKPMADITVAMDMFPANVNTADQRLKPDARAEHLQAAVVNVLSKPWRALQGAGQDETRILTSAKARLLTVDPETPANAHLRARTLKRWDAADITARARMINDLAYEGLAALIVSGALDDVPAELRGIAEDRYMVMRHIYLSGLQANFQKIPDFDSPLATGPDVEAATKAAELAFDDHKARLDDIDAVRRTLQNVVTIAAIVCDLKMDVAFNLLVTGKAA